MPDLGESVTEGTVTRWLKRVGDRVEVDEPLLEVSTDKVDTEIPSPAAGLLTAILVEDDGVVAVGGELAVIGEEPTPAAPPLTSSQLDATPVPSAEPASRAANDGAGTAESTSAAAPSGEKLAVSSAQEAVAGTTRPMPRLRRVIADRMVQSLAVSAQLTTVQEVDLSRVVALRERAKAEFRHRHGVGLTYLPFIAKAAVEALRAFPAFNASITDDGQIAYHSDVHLAVAVDTPRGLLVPVIRNADELSVAGLAKAIADVAARTRNNTIGVDELAGGTFTITNIGSVGTLFDTPIINQPQAAILATGAVVKRPVVVATAEAGTDAIAIRSMCFLPLTYDHRLVDGADAGRFVSAIRERLAAGAFEPELGL
ncbi:2-oxo acid dehydrogenase subunit E2 [Pseudonocardia kujensis]|uniref:2-oxo acid dehydrogenase subunit E2 n=1 Tax=Pseudonocardia kujensis TaxID=1128675 RepID=UPI001E508277|nr:2-oxo acid dehydrogenase subunit E2 [Pseudonocardia kujensis]MCE0767598.1 2-oxo acid dehydrogenase subunit E2 [Pseudonocardia kujensis]